MSKLLIITIVYWKCLQHGGNNQLNWTNLFLLDKLGGKNQGRGYLIVTFSQNIMLFSNIVYLFKVPYN